MSFSTVLPTWSQDQHLVMLEPCPRFPTGDFVIRSGVAINVLAKNYSYARELGEFWSWMPVTEALPLLKSAVVPAPAGPQVNLEEAKRLLASVDEHVGHLQSDASEISRLVASLGEGLRTNT